jgi:hypothetical protein
LRADLGLGADLIAALMACNYGHCTYLIDMVIEVGRLTMFRPIRIRTGSANFCPHNTPLLFVNNMR